MDLQLFCFPGNEAFEKRLLQYDGIYSGKMTIRRFPDGESYVRLCSDVTHKDLAVLLSLHQPDEKILSLYYFAKLARQFGAKSITFIAPYLAYMRQDQAFKPGEVVTSGLFAQLLSDWVDAILTFDPHLHRIRDLSEIYSIPTLAIPAEPLISDYIKSFINKPVLIGPDEESRQWVERIARQVGCDFMVLQKERLGDHSVRVTLPGIATIQDRTPVLVDDIISTGRTMIETAAHFQEQGFPAPVCIGVHGIFAGNAYRELKDAGIETIVTTNTIPHPSNGIDVSGLVPGALRQLPY